MSNSCKGVQLDIQIMQSGAATHLRQSDNFIPVSLQFIPECSSERIIKVSPHENKTATFSWTMTQTANVTRLLALPVFNIYEELLTQSTI